MFHRAGDQHTNGDTVRGPKVPMDTVFKPQAKKEIGDIKWFPIKDLPLAKTDTMPPNALNLKPNQLFMVMPFVK